MENCVFCKIIAGEIPSPRLYEDEKMIVIRDIQPRAKLHYLCIPKKHFPTLYSMSREDVEYLRHCFDVIPKIEEDLGLEDGYRLVINQGFNGGQTVAHLHIHLLGGEGLGEF